MAKINVNYGDKYGRLSVINEVKKDGIYRKVKCICDCGNHCIVLLASLKAGQTKSCGCYRKEKASNRRICGEEVKIEYKTWYDMHRRCYNKKYSKYIDYGGRGISVCDRWFSFENFIHDIGKRPSAKHSLDRIDNNGNYEANNCRWATGSEQNSNRRSSNIITHCGETLSICQWEKKLGFKKSTISARFKLNWSIEKALTTKVRFKKQNITQPL
jgi:hypothetical protein